MLTGRLSFAGQSSPQLLDALLHHDPPSIARYNDHVPDALVRIVAKMLEKDPEHRYQSVHEVWSDLRRIRDELTGARPAATDAPVRPRPAAARRWVRYVAAGIVIAVLGAVVAGGRVWWQAHRVASATDIASVVALPAKVFGPPDDQYLTDAVPAALSMRLASVVGLETKVSPTSQEVEQVHGDLSRIGSAYGVNGCVLSTITAGAGRLALAIQLVDPFSKRVLWSAEYEGRRDEYLDLMRGASDGLRATLRPGSPAISVQPGITPSSEVELLFRRGRYLSNRYNNRHEPADFDAAMQAFARGLELDPKLADAAAEISWLFEFKFEAGAPAAEMLAPMETWAGRAVAINPRSTKGWAALSMVELLRPKVDTNKAIENALKGASFGPQIAFSQLTLALAPIGPTLSLEAARQTYRTDPLYLYGANAVAAALFDLGRPVEAPPYLDQILAIEPDFSSALTIKLWIVAGLGRMNEAEDILRRLDTQAARGTFPAFGALVSRYPVLLGRGEHAQAEDTLHLIVKRFVDPATPAFEFHMWIDALVPTLARSGKTDVALQLVASSVSHNYVPPYDWLMLNPELAPLRRDPRFAALSAKSRAQFEEMVQVLNGARTRGELPTYLEQPLADLLVKLGMRARG